MARELKGHRNCVYSVHANAQHLVSGSADKTGRVWDGEAAQQDGEGAQQKGRARFMSYVTAAAGPRRGALLGSGRVDAAAPARIVRVGCGAERPGKKVRAPRDGRDRLSHRRPRGIVRFHARQDTPWGLRPTELLPLPHLPLV
mgnify:CR=1 FL=1